MAVIESPEMITYILLFLWISLLYIAMKYQKILVSLSFIISIFLFQYIGLIALFPMCISLYFMLMYIVESF